MKNKIEFLNPEGLHKNPAFSQSVILEGNYKTIYIGGQNGANKDGKVVGNDIEAQAKQVLINLKTALKSAGASLKDIIQWTVFVVQGQPLENGFKVFQGVIKNMKNPPIITMAYVSALGNPDFLMELSAIAIVLENK